MDKKRLFPAFIFLLYCFPIMAKNHPHKMAKTRHLVDFMSKVKTLQIESYCNFESNNGQFSTSHPSILMRYGIIDKLELRLGFDCSSLVDANLYNTKVGFSPIQPGFKIQFNQSKNFVPSFAMSTSITIPKAASANFAQTYWAPAILLYADQNLDQNSTYSLEYSVGLAWDADNFQRIYSAYINTEINVTPANTFYADVYLFKPQKDAFDIRADIGINHNILSNLQFDLSSGIGFTTAAPEFFLNAGIVFAYNKWKKKPTTHPYPSKRKN